MIPLLSEKTGTLELAASYLVTVMSIGGQLDIVGSWTSTNNIIKHRNHTIHCHIISDNCMALTAKLQYIGKELIIYEFI